MEKSLIPLCVAAVGVLRSADRNLYRLLLRMDSGATRTVDLDDPTFFPDERVEVTSDGRVVHLSTFRLGAKS